MYWYFIIFLSFVLCAAKLLRTEERCLSLSLASSCNLCNVECTDVQYNAVMVVYTHVYRNHFV